jgi:ribosome assembly protein RRB1
VEDVQFSPSQEHVLASCSVDQTVKLWDLRATQLKAQISFRAHECDVNVLSWNTVSKFLLASGDDRGEFRVWDLRMLNPSKGSSFDSIARIRWHTQAITSLQFEPGEDSVLAVASADNKLTIWDFSVEVDEGGAA